MRFKKFLCYILCGFLTFGVVSTANYKSAHAMEWVSGALSFAETLTWVLASLGITCTVSDYATEVDKSRSEFWEDYEQDFYDYVNEHEGNTASDRFIEWKNKLCKGVLDKSSEYWSMFKSWASNLVNNSSSSGGLSSGASYLDTINFLNNYFNYTLPDLNELHSYNIYSILKYTNSSNREVFYLSFSSNLSNVYINSSNSYICDDGCIRFESRGSLSTWSYAVYNNSINIPLSASNNPYKSANLINQGNLSFSDIPFGDSISTDSNFDSVTSNVDDLDVISSDGVDEDSPEVTLPYPGVSDSDDTISSDAYQDIIDAINDGTITQEDGVIEIQKILKIITYDTVTDDVVPPIKDDDGNNKKKDDVLKENKENAGFSLGGLEAVFPFCIPFDIYAFMTLLVAKPVAPEFDFPIQSVNGQEEEIHIDLSPFEPVAVVVRYCFDFLFIIGLGLITRQLIGAGGGD